MYNHSIRRRYLCDRPRQQLGCAVATYRSASLSFRSYTRRSRTNFSEICPWDICCSRYWTHTRRRWARTWTKKYQISPSRSNWPGLGTLVHLSWQRSLHPWHPDWHVSENQMRCILYLDSDSASVYHLFNMVLIPKAPGRLLQHRRSIQECQSNTFWEFIFNKYLLPWVLKQRAQLDLHHLQGRHPMFNLYEATDSAQ